MHKRWSEFFIVDILVAIDKIKRATSNLTFEPFVANEQIVDSVLRNLEIIGEASGQLLKDSNFLNDTYVEWRKIVNLRNVIIHFYFGVDLDEVFNGIVLNEIPSLEVDILKFIKQKDDPSKFLLAIEDAKADLAEVFRFESVEYLEKVEKKIK